MVESTFSVDGQTTDNVYMPNELMRFIRRETYSLLIKGFAGTGKTTLALTILKALESKNNFFYISTRVSPKQLFQYYPWVEKFVEPPQTASSMDTSEHGLMPSFEDARLDEPESLFERITNQLMDIKSPIIIVDSWDAIASFMDKEARLNNERVLQTWRERAGAKLIFISEYPSDNTLDFLVDGIVELSQRCYESLRVREITFLKLRGVRIERPSYIYTLDNSVFRSFVPYRPITFRPEMRSEAFTEDTIASADQIRTGYPTLDSSLGGGFPRKAVVLLQLDAHVNTVVAIAFLERLVSNFISTRNTVLFQPFDWMDPHAIMSYLGPSMPAAKRKFFKILWMRKVAGMADTVMFLDKKHHLDLCIAALAKMKQKHPGRLLLNIMGTDILQRSYGQEGVRRGIESQMSDLRTSPDLTIAVVSYSQEDVLQYLSEVSDMHLRFLMINGTLFLQTIVPASTLYSVVFDRHQLTLAPVV